MARDFVYKETEDSIFEQRLQNRGGFSREGIFKKGNKIFAPKVGEQYRIRILPPTWDGSKYYGYDAWIHYEVGPDKSSYLCLKKMKGEDCPICEALLSKQATTDPVYAKKLRAKYKVVVYLIDRNDPDMVPKLWAMPPQFETNIVIQSRDEDTGKNLRIDNPDFGYDVLFNTVKGKTKDIAFQYEGEKVARKSSPIANDEKTINAILEHIVDNPIPEVLEYKTYEYIKKVFEGALTTSKDDDDETVDDAPAPQSEPKKMTREEMEEYAIDELGLKRRDIKDKSDEELASLIASKPEEEKVEEAPVDDRIAALRSKKWK
jgi:hypothetical protein